MPKHKPTKEERLDLFYLESGYHFDLLVPTRPPELSTPGPDGRLPPWEPPNKPTIRCKIIHRLTKEAYAEAIGYEERDALAAAIVAAKAAKRPQTPTDVAKERDALKAKLAELEAKGTPTQAPITPMPPAPSIMDTDVGPVGTSRKGKPFDTNPGSSFKS